MPYLYAFLGFVALIVLHEAGHFTAAKAVGMRVERFCLFFPPLIAKVRRGDTEYGIGAIPLGGYVKITGMSPNEEIPPELVPRAYYNQPVWKRIVVIAAGPAVNLVLAIVIVWALLMSSGEFSEVVTKRVAQVAKGSPAAQVLRPGDRIVSADGVAGNEETLHRLIERHRCAGTPTDGCRAATPVRLVVERHGRLIHVSVRPRYATVSIGQGRTETAMLIGVTFAGRTVITHPSLLQAGSDSVTKLWSVTKQTLSTIVQIFKPKERSRLHGVVGTFDATAGYFATSTTEAIEVLALISLSLGIINLFPFLPLDGGHIFWAVAEKVRRRRIPFSVMERAGVVGFVLILVLFVIGLSNDITGISNGTLGVH
ncbi:MAG TPA: M50 family metallopeptidase [Solirubrobacteraceae bacterium]|nr:M50 family metallopeptidase [Solirubrobacteraceae bacterium]